jgi:hypothetical protein
MLDVNTGTKVILEFRENEYACQAGIMGSGVFA